MFESWKCYAQTLAFKERSRPRNAIHFHKIRDIPKPHVPLCSTPSFWFIEGRDGLQPYGYCTWTQ